MISLPPSVSRRVAAARFLRSAIDGPWTAATRRRFLFGETCLAPTKAVSCHRTPKSPLRSLPRGIQHFHSTGVASRPSTGFTLIELLVVISIIAILAALAFPAVNGAINSARKAQARNDVQQIVAAVKAFQSEYGRMPTTTPAPTTQPPNEQSGDAYHRDNNDVVIRILMGQNTQINPKGIVFLDAKTTTSKKGGVDLADYKFYDPWGTPYAIKLDNNYSGKIEYYSPSSDPNIFNSAMAVSAGPDKQFDNPYSASGAGKDDICSFK